MARRRSGKPPAETVPSGQVTIRLSRAGSNRCESIDPARISDVLTARDALLWVDVRDPGPAEMGMLQTEFGFHRLALEDAAKQRQRPKVDEYTGYYFVVTYALVSAEDPLAVETAEVDLFVGPNYVVSLHQGEVPALHEALTRWDRTDPDLRHQVGFLLYTLVDAIVDAYFPIVDALEDRVDDVELAMFAPGGGYNPEDLLAIKRSLYGLRKVMYPLREVFNVFLRREDALFSPETYPYLQDVYDHILRLLDVIDIERDMATGALEAHLSVISNRLNETMKRLTVVAICVAILGAVFGAWGMNFTVVPLGTTGLTGFLIVSGGALALVGLTLVIARRCGFW